MKENAKLYRNIRLSRFHTKDSNPKYQAHLALETVVEVAISLQDLEVACDAAAIPNPMHVADPEVHN